MGQKRTDKKEALTIGGMLLLVAALTLGVALIFRGLESIMPERQASSYTQLSGQNGWSAPYGMRLLDEQEREGQAIQTWLESSQEWMDWMQNEDIAFWMYRMDEDEYILYLPGQSRQLEAADVTATEERDTDGEVALVLRVRTPEGGDELLPEEQQLCFKTDSTDWNGIRLRIVLDGREQQVQKTANLDGKLYSAEELYIGRDAK